MGRFSKSNLDETYSGYNNEFKIDEFRQGNDREFKRVYDDLYSHLICFAKKIVRSSFDADDIVATAFLRLSLVRGTMTSYDYIAGWMFVVVYHCAIDHLRSRKRLTEVMEKLDYLSDYTQAAINSEKQKAFLLHVLYKAIDQLPPQRRKILLLYFFEKRTTFEIADMLELRPQTVLNHKAMALELLRKTLPLLNLVPARYLKYC